MTRRGGPELPVGPLRARLRALPTEQFVLLAVRSGVSERMLRRCRDGGEPGSPQNAVSIDVLDAIYMELPVSLNEDYPPSEEREAA